jgi:hypothetical protein
MIAMDRLMKVVLHTIKTMTEMDVHQEQVKQLQLILVQAGHREQLLLEIVMIQIRAYVLVRLVQDIPHLQLLAALRVALLQKLKLVAQLVHGAVLIQ